MKRARALRGWTLDELGAAVKPKIGKSLLSKIENGQKDTLTARSVGRLILALDLDPAWVDRFLVAGTAGDDAPPDTDETPAERDADRIFDRITRDDATAGASEDLLIALANAYAGGSYRDLQTAYDAVRIALETAAALRARGAMPGDNVGSQLTAVMAEVARLNDAGALDQADAVLDAAERRMLADQQATQERMAEARRQMLNQRLSQDRLRNDPKAAADRLLADLRQQPDRGKLFPAISRLLDEWLQDGERRGDIFALRVALELARRNWDRVKGKRGLEAIALHDLGICYLRLGERSSRPRDLELAHNAIQAAVDRTSPVKDATIWAACQGGLGGVLMEMGERAADPAIMRRAIAANRSALGVLTADEDSKDARNNLGGALTKLGEITRDAAPLTEAVAALTTALSLKNRAADPLDWTTTRNNLALALRWQGALTGDRALLQQARDAYAACETIPDLRQKAAFRWAGLQWNIADLALARHDLDPDPALLDEAEHHVRAARAVFVDGSDYQTERCDDLLARIAAARLPA